MKKIVSLVLVVMMLITMTGAALAADGEEMYTFTVMYPRKAQHPTDFSNMWYVKKMQEKFNIDLKFNLVEEVAWEEKKALAFAANDLPDIFLDGITNNDENMYGPLGMLIDLAPYVDQYAPNLKKLFAEYDDVRKSYYTPEGALYCIPAFRAFDRDMVIYPYSYNKQWMKDLGFEKIETLDDLYDYLVAIRDKDPNGNGIADEIPVSGVWAKTTADTTGSIADQSRNPFLCAVGFVDSYDDVVNDKYVYVPAEENYRVYLEFMHKLWDENLLDHDSFTQTTQEMYAKLADWKIGLLPTAPVSQVLASGHDMYDFSYLPSLTSSVNNTKMAKMASHSQRDIGSLAITPNCKNPEVVVAWIDSNYTLDGSIMVRLGPESGEVEGTANGYIPHTLEDGSLFFETLFDGFTSFYEFRCTQCPLDVPYFNDQICAELTTKGDPVATAMQDWFHDGNRLPDARLGYPDVKLSDEEQDQLLAFNDINAYVDQMEAQFITGVIEINDQTWADYLAALDGMNLQSLKQIKQDAYDRWNSVK